MKFKHFYDVARSRPSFGWKLLMLLFIPAYMTAQVAPLSFCGYYHANPPNGTNPDSIILDRFGNQFDFEDLQVPPQVLAPNASCTATGYFAPTYYGSIPSNAMDAVCKVLEDISAIIPHRQGQMDCGTVPPQNVNVQVAWLSFSNPDPAIVDELELNLPIPNAGAIASPFYSNPQDLACHEVMLDRPFIKINGGRTFPEGGFDGRILINSDYSWNYNFALPTGGFAGQLNLYSITLHEAMHMLGFASRMGFTDAYTLWDQT